MQIGNLNPENIRMVAGLIEHQWSKYNPDLEFDVLEELENIVGKISRTRPYDRVKFAILIPWKRVDSLGIKFQQLSSFPVCIFMLKSLTFLNLQKCELTSLPENIGLLTELTYLGLESNHLTELPESFGQRIETLSQ